MRQSMDAVAVVDHFIKLLIVFAIGPDLTRSGIRTPCGHCQVSQIVLYLCRFPIKRFRAGGVGYEEIYCRFISPSYNPDGLHAVARTDTATSGGTTTRTRTRVARRGGLAFRYSCRATNRATCRTAGRASVKSSLEKSPSRRCDRDCDRRRRSLLTCKRCINPPSPPIKLEK